MVVEIPKRLKPGDVAVLPHRMVNPLGIVEHLWTRHHEIFERVLGSIPRQFWSQVHPGDPKLAALGDIRELEDWQDICYPVAPIV